MFLLCNNVLCFQSPKRDIHPECADDETKVMEADDRAERTSFGGCTDFLAIGESLSISLAARALGASKSVVSRRLQRLEQDLATQLVQRNTRRVALTEEGALYFESLRGIPAQLRQAGERLQQRRQRPAGHIKFILPSYLGSSSITRTLLPQFMMDHPEVSPARSPMNGARVAPQACSRSPARHVLVGRKMRRSDE